MESRSKNKGRALSGLRRAFRRVLDALRGPRQLPEAAGVEVQADIGDRIAAIKFLADSQGPWKALLEQVENAIDEYPPGYRNRGPIEVRIVGRGQSSYIMIKDHGRGFVPDEEGIPDLKGVITRVANSFKGKIEDYKGAQGEFAVGLFGFRTIGRQMTIETKTDYAGYPNLAKEYGLRKKAKSPTYVMTMDGETLTARIERSDTERREPGTAITIKKLLNPRLWNGPKVKKAIEEELWGRLLEKGLTVRVVDRRKVYEVIPKERAFDGALFPRSSLPTKFGPVHLELYVLEREDASAAVPVLRAKEEGSGATRVYKNIKEIDEFQCPPWNMRRIQGWVRFDGATLSGPHRGQFLQDEKYHAFVEALKGIEDELSSMIRIQDAQREKIGLRRMLKKLRGDLERVCRELPHLDIFRIARSRPDSLFITSPPKKRASPVIAKRPPSKGNGGDGYPKRRRLVGLPLPEFVTDGVSWRSRYVSDQHIVYINKGHPDYERESVTHKRWYRYLLKLYTKELVLQCYNGTEEEAKLLEAAIEAQIRAEEDL
ncbi:MAG: hypothetical protein ACE5HJ_08610 [Thermoplasmata archaeon]